MNRVSDRFVRLAAEIREKMEVFDNDATVDPTTKMINGRSIDVQLTADENCVNFDAQPVTKMHIEFDDLSYWVQHNKGKLTIRGRSKAS